MTDKKKPVSPISVGFHKVSPQISKAVHSVVNGQSAGAYSFDQALGEIDGQRRVQFFKDTDIESELKAFVETTIHRTWREKPSYFELSYMLASVYTKGSYYDWHVDGGRSVGRFRYTLVQLIDRSSDLRGGELEVHLAHNGQTQTFLSEPGDFIFFPATFAHRVKTVEQGWRVSLISMWFFK